jgi:hypothetical protein
MGTLRAVVGLLLISCPALAAADDADEARARAAVSRAGVPFVENVGQTDPEIRFFARTLGGALLVSRSGELALSLPAGGASRERVVLRESLRHGRVREIQGLEPSAARVSFFTGSDPSRWRSGLPTWDTVTLGEVWPGVELRLRAQGGTVEKIFRVRPGGDPRAIEVAVGGARRLSVTPDGALSARTGRGDVRFSRPVAWQEGPAGRVPVEVAYRVSGRRYGFAVGEYDRARELIVDPFVSTYLGGSGAEAGYGVDVRVDPGSGALQWVYVAGRTTSVSGWLIAGKPTGGTDGGGATDAFVARLDPSLQSGTPGYLTVAYLGGSGDDEAHDVAVHEVDLDGDPDTTADRETKVFLTGTTTSADFPLASGAGRGGGEDAFVARLSEDLSALDGSRYLGGSDRDRGEAIAVGDQLDTDGTVLLPGDRVFVAGTTRSSFPGTAGGAYTSGWGFVARLTPDVQSIFQATYAGQSHGIALRPDGAVYVAGEELRTVPNPDPPPATVTSNDPFVLALDAGLRTVIGLTYVGGPGGGVELGTGVAVDPRAGRDAGPPYAWHDLNVYLVGVTTCDAAVPANEYQDPANDCAGAQDAFVTRFDQDLVPTGALFLGGSEYDRAVDVQVLRSGEVIVLGTTDGGLVQITPGALQPVSGGAKDLFVASLALQGTGELSVQAATYLGGPGLDEILYRGLAAAGTDLFVTGMTSSSGFPGITAASAQPIGGGSFDAFVARLDATLAANPWPDLEVAPLAIDFGNVAPGTATRRYVSVGNVGVAALQVTGMSLSGPGMTRFGFEVTGEPPAGGPALCPTAAPTLLRGERCSVAIVFQPPPGVTPPTTATFTITSTGGEAGDERADVQLGGRSEPDIRVLPATLPFAPTQLGASAVATISIGNEGAADLLVDDIAVFQGPSTPAGTFSLTFGSPGFCRQPATNDSLVLRGGSACSVLVTFTPPAVQADADPPYAADVVIRSNDPDQEDTVTVVATGRGVAAPTQPVTATPRSIDFGGVTEPASRLVWVENHGASPVKLSYAVTSDDPVQAAQFPFDADYEPTSAPCEGLLHRGTLPAGMSCAVEVTYDPRTSGTHHAALVVAYGFEPVGSLPPVEGSVEVQLSGAAGADGDGDAVLDSEEGGPVHKKGYDGNHDGVADAEQASVASLRSLDGSRYVTIATSVGTLEAVSGDATPADAPDTHAYPFGFFRLTVVVPAPGASARVTVYPDAVEASPRTPTWMKRLGPGDWVDLALRAEAGVTWADGALGFTLVDGGTGDGDGQANGRIVDPGGPAWPKDATPTEPGGGGGCGCGTPGDAGLGAVALAWLALAFRRRPAPRA